MRDEGFRATEYDDQTGKPSWGEPDDAVVGKRTIGYGFNVTDGDRHLLETVIGGQYRGQITQPQATRLLEVVLRDTEERLRTKLPWLAFVADTQPVRYAVLLNMAYNMGVTKLLRFKTTLELVKTGHYTTAASAMLDSLWAKQLGRRPRVLSDMMAVGVYTEPAPSVW
jgi:lysozyme